MLEINKIYNDRILTVFFLIRRQKMDNEFSNLIESELKRAFSYVTKFLGKKMDDYSFIVIKYNPDKKKMFLSNDNELSVLLEDRLGIVFSAKSDQSMFRRWSFYERSILSILHTLCSAIQDYDHADSLPILECTMDVNTHIISYSKVYNTLS